MFTLTGFREEVEHCGHSTYGSSEPGLGDGIPYVHTRRSASNSTKFIHSLGIQSISDH